MGMFDNLAGDTDSYQELVRVIDGLFDNKNINLKTRLNMQRIKILVQLKIHIELLDDHKSSSQVLIDAIEYYKELLISYKSMSRKETIQSLNGISKMIKDQAEHKRLGEKESSL